MAYDELLGVRMRAALGPLPGLEEKKMFGGIGFLVNGNMACGVHKNNMIVRVGPENYSAALARAAHPPVRHDRSPDGRLGHGRAARLRDRK